MYNEDLAFGDKVVEVITALVQMDEDEVGAMGIILRKYLSNKVFEYNIFHDNKLCPFLSVVMKHTRKRDAFIKLVDNVVLFMSDATTVKMNGIEYSLDEILVPNDGVYFQHSLVYNDSDIQKIMVLQRMVESDVMQNNFDSISVTLNHMLRVHGIISRHRSQPCLTKI